MRKNDIRFVQVYRINGRLVVANSIEGAITTWREYMLPCSPDINSIERIGNDSYQFPGSSDGLMFSDISGDVYPQLTEELAEKSETIERLRYELEKMKTLVEELQAKPESAE